GRHPDAPDRARGRPRVRQWPARRRGGGVIAPSARYRRRVAVIQSSTCRLLAVEGKIPSFDAAVFADTGWEPAAVYTHLDRLVPLPPPPPGPTLAGATG